jgi:hypothetical protein
MYSCKAYNLTDTVAITYSEWSTLIIQNPFSSHPYTYQTPPPANNQWNVAQVTSFNFND